MTQKRPLFIYRVMQWVVLMVGALSAITLNAAVNQPISAKTISDLLRGPMTFTQKIDKFSYDYNAAYPQNKIPPYHQHKSLTQHGAIYFSSKINNTLYSSVISDSKTGHVTSLQLTYIAPKMNTTEQDITPPINKTVTNNDNATVDLNPINDSNVIAVDYMTTLYQWFNPTKSQDYCQKEIIRLLKVGRDEPLYEEIINNLRYVVVDHGEKGITLAVEPIKLAAIP